MFDKLKNTLAKVAGDLIGEDLGRLNAHGKALGDKAVQYVKTGDGGTVLATLSNTDIPHKLLFDTPFMAKTRSKPVLQRRQEFFLDASPYDPALMARYGQVLAACRGKLGGDRGLAGPDTADPALRIFFGQAFEGALKDINSWPRQAREARIKGLTPEAAVAVGAELDASAAEVMGILFWKGSQWGTSSSEKYLELVDIKDFAAAHPDPLIEASRHLDAESRSDLATRLGRDGLATLPPYFELIFDLAGGSAKSVREAALSVLLSLPAATVEPRAIAALDKGTVSLREAMVNLLSKLGKKSAAGALQAHLKKEKTARIISAIENAQMAAGASGGQNDEGHDDATGYVALDGSRVDIPPRRDVQEDPSVKFGKDMQDRIQQAVEEYNASALKVNAELTKKKQKWGHWRVIKSPAKLAKVSIMLFNTGTENLTNNHQEKPYFFLRERTPQILNEILDQLPLHRLVNITLSCGHEKQFRLHSFLAWYAPAQVRNWLGGPDGDFRVVDELLLEGGYQAELGHWSNRVKRSYQKGDALYQMMPEYDWMSEDLNSVSDSAIWPFLAENLAIMDEALGVSAKGDVAVRKLPAVHLLGRLPKTPARYFGPLLEIATGEGKAGRAEARALLADAKGVDDRLIALLSDSRQAIRAGSAEWLAARACTEAVKPLKARLKKEKSELARAAILTALQGLGEDLSSFVGPTALIREAEAGLKKAKLDKLDWLGLDHLPKLKWGNGKTVPDDVVRWWLFLANKLKQPGGNALFEIYLDQLAPDSAETLSAWVFDAWIAYDTRQPSEAEGIAHAKANVKKTFAEWSRWWKDLTEEATFQMLKREITGQYLNSGAASKGILALATRVPATHGADRVRQYLRTHGKRTSQATSLLELLAAKGDAVSLQVVISAATRLKQKGVQAKASEMIEAVADARGWTMQELADRTIPTGGLDDDGVLDLPCGPDEKPYRAQLGDDLSLTLSNPDGKIIKALPTGDDDATKAAKKQLSTSKKEIKQVAKAQADRLYEALCAERIWPLADWKRDFQNHPIMRRLIERVVWIGLDDQGEPTQAFRPTAEGDLTDADDTPVSLDGVSALRLAHGALLDEAAGTAWQSHMQDYEIKPLFSQFGRPLLRLTDAQKSEQEIIDRKGWLTDAFNIRGAAGKLGYDRGEALDGGFFCDYVKHFKSADIIAIIEFSGNGLPEENVTAVLKTLRFARKYSGYNVTALDLSEVPPVLLSECWNDYHEMAAKAQFDPKWEEKVPW